MGKNEAECVETLMKQLSIEDPYLTNPVSHEQPLSTDSEIVQQKLKEMKELLKNLYTSEINKKVDESFDQFANTRPKFEVFSKANYERSDFRLSYMMYEYILITNIRKIEENQSVVLSNLHPLEEKPKLIEFTKYMESSDKIKKNEIYKCSAYGHHTIGS